MTGIVDSRQTLVRRGLVLNYATLGYNGLEGLIAIAAGLAAGSIALLGFGLDSLIEVSASVAALWRLYRDRDERHRIPAERITLRIIGALFLGLDAYVAVTRRVHYLPALHQTKASSGSCSPQFRLPSCHFWRGQSGG